MRPLPLINGWISDKPTNRKSDELNDRFVLIEQSWSLFDELLGV
jgi:hypothetical protein